MGSHLIDGKFQSDKHPTTPPGKVPLSVEDPTAQDLLWEYAQRRRSVDAELADLEAALRIAGYAPEGSRLRRINGVLVVDSGGGEIPEEVFDLTTVDEDEGIGKSPRTPEERAYAVECKGSLLSWTL